MPSGASVAVQLAEPPDKVAVHRELPLVENDTVPVGVPDDERTVAEYVTDAPCLTLLGVTDTEVVVGAVIAAAKTVPVSSERLGLDEALRVDDTHAGGPGVYAGAGFSGSQAPLPPDAVGFHHARESPPFRLQSFTATALKELPLESTTSKYSPGEEKLGAPTGFEVYCATVSAPTPVADAVVPLLVAIAVLVALDDEALVELVAPVGAGGGVVGTVTGGGEGEVHEARVHHGL